MEFALELQLYVGLAVLGALCLLLCVLVSVLFYKLAVLTRKVDELQTPGRVRVQKLRVSNETSHAFHNPGLVPDEELSKRGYSMFQQSEADVESQRGPPERKMSPVPGPAYVEELTRELDNRRSTAPPFLLQAIQENKKKNRLVSANGETRQTSETNPNFIY